MIYPAVPGNHLRKRERKWQRGENGGSVWQMCGIGKGDFDSYQSVCNILVENLGRRQHSSYSSAQLETIDDPDVVKPRREGMA